MALDSVHLTHFRNYENLRLGLSSGVNLVVGANAQGKTNLLEAIYLLSTGRLLRGMKDSEAIQAGQTKAEVWGMLTESGTELKLTLEAGLRKRAYLNSASLPRTSDLLGRLPSVIFSNDDLAIVREDAASRRMFMDTELSQIYPAYFRHFAAYKRALEQRNALLKVASEQFVALDQFEPWEVQLSEHGDAMREYRTKFIENLEALGRPIQSELAHGERIELKYLPKDTGPLASSLQESRVHDIRRGSTTVGPHRDDFLISVGSKEARLYGSQGQQRTAAITLKLATMRVIHETLGMPPLILLDDVLSELDAHRREHLLHWVGSVQAQTILTCTEAEQAGSEIRSKATIFRVNAGTVES